MQYKIKALLVIGAFLQKKMLSIKYQKKSEKAPEVTIREKALDNCLLRQCLLMTQSPPFFLFWKLILVWISLLFFSSKVHLQLCIIIFTDRKPEGQERLPGLILVTYQQPQPLILLSRGELVGGQLLRPCCCAFCPIDSASESQSK